MEEFEQDQVIYPLVDKLEKLLDKNKTDKAEKVITQLENLLLEQDHAISVSYILSILAENDFKLINVSILEKLESNINTNNPKLKLNTFITIGFAMLSSHKHLDAYCPKFIEHLVDSNKDVRDNIYYFLQEIVKDNPTYLCRFKENFINILLTEEVEENLITLMSFLEKCSEFDFENLFSLRGILKSVLKQHGPKESSKLYLKTLSLAKHVFPTLRDLEIEDFELKELLLAIQDIFLMKKYNFTEISKETGVDLKVFVKNMNRKNQRERKIFFYTINKDQKKVFCYELEREKLVEMFGKEEKLQKKDILKKFSPIIYTDQELRLFLDTLLKIGHVKGYYSKLGYFYSYNYVKSNLLESLHRDGIVSSEEFDYLPSDFIARIMKEVTDETKRVFLIGKNYDAYYSLKNIQRQINTEAAKNPTINLKMHRDRLEEKDFIRLIKNLPEGYLTYYRSGTQWLTNVGLLKVKKEIEISRLIGYYSIPMLSEKLNIKKELLVQILENFIDLRSGIFDKDKEVFYYSKFLNQKIEEINSITDKNEKKKQINLMARKLNIDKGHILTKLDENLQLIGEEIKAKDIIEINQYIEKTGMSYDSFIDFINDLGLLYLKKGDLLIFNEEKIEESKKDIKSMLIEKSRSENIIQLGDIDVTSSIVENLLIELQNDEKIKGIFHDNEGNLVFYTEKGLEALMLENNFMFSFHDFFYGKILQENEIETLSLILENLLNKRKLNGTFDEETLTFASSDVVFAQDYNAVLYEFEKMIALHINTFKTEFEKIKKVLTKQSETIYPQEIKMIQGIIDVINEKYIHWRNGIEAFVRKANTSLLKKQGYTIKKYKSMSISAEKKEEIKLFEEDPEVIDLTSGFNNWVKLFNELELKYGNIIFYQKRLIKDTENEENRKKLEDLLTRLKLL
ncbi:MAG: hypothetical protein ACXABG_03620 [Promethearchaeota archaeon]